MKKLFTLFAVLATAITASAENYILYTSSDGNIIEPAHTDVFGATIISNTYENGQGKILFDGDVTAIGKSAFHNCNKLKSIVIPSTATTIGMNAFTGCTKLTSVEIPNSVTSIGNGAFGSCDHLISINIPNSVTSIGHGAFEKCYKLESIVIPNSVTTIGEIAFESCINLTSVEIPNSVTSLGYGVFTYCPKIESFTGKFASEDHRFLIVDGVMNSFAPAGLTSYQIPNSVTQIGRAVFSLCSNLTSIDIPNSVTLIGEEAFANCTGLTSIDIPNSVHTIGINAFSCCYGLANVQLPNSVTLIRDGAFRKCRDLTTINLPNSLTELGASVFRDCVSLPFIEIPSSLNKIGQGVFWGCTGLVSVANHSSQTLSHYDLFESCTNLKSIVFSNEVNNINIGEDVFYGCENKIDVYSFNPSPPTCSKSLYSEVPPSSVLRVPAPVVEDYKAAEYWMEFPTVKSLSDLEDGEDYYLSLDYPDCDITYTRNFATTNWQALFVPFAMEYSDWSGLGTVAELTGVEDGVLVWRTLGAGSSTVAGKPYIFKPAKTGEAVFSVEDATLVSYRTVNPVEYSGYVLSGTYQEKKDMALINGYALAGGNFYCTTDEEKTLRPYRIFLTVPEQAGQTQAPIRSIIDGEDVTAIDGLTIDDLTVDNRMFNLSGQRVGQEYKGIVIQNGKKVVRK